MMRLLYLINYKCYRILAHKFRFLSSTYSPEKKLGYLFSVPNPDGYDYSDSPSLVQKLSDFQPVATALGWKRIGR